MTNPAELGRSTCVVMTAYNSAGTIRGSIDSALAATESLGCRVIIVDDGSTDGTAAVARAIGNDRVELVEAGRVGRARALNVGLDAAAGVEFVANLDADDYMRPGRIEAQAAYLRENSAVGVVGSDYLEVHEAQGMTAVAYKVEPPADPADIRRQLAASFPICHSVATYRRDAALEVGGFDPRRRSRIDFDLWLRMATGGYDLANVRGVYGIHTKAPGTYFDRQWSRLRSANEMARLNFNAVRKLRLGPSGFAVATARYGYSLLRSRSIRGVPRFASPCDELPADYLHWRGGSDEQRNDR